jgi:hypothetical protein
MNSEQAGRRKEPAVADLASVLPSLTGSHENNLSQDSRHPARDSKRAALTYKSEAFRLERTRLAKEAKLQADPLTKEPCHRISKRFGFVRNSE